MRFLISALLVLAPGSVNADPIEDSIEAIPKLTRLEHGRSVVIVRGTLAETKQRDAVEIVDQVVADVQRRFTRKTSDIDRPVTLVLMPDDPSYLRAARALDDDDDVPSMWGFYRPDKRIAIANLGASIGNLRHELVHPLLGDDFPNIPAWLNEGIAALYGTAKWSKKKGFTFLVNYRLRDLQKAIRADTLPTIAELAMSSDADVRGEHAGTYYAMSRYVLLYVEQRGKLSQLYAELRDAPDAKTQRDVLTSYIDDDAFVTWAKKLRY